MPGPEPRSELSTSRAGAVLTIDLDAIVANWRLLDDKLGPAEAAAVVKADGYGLGASRVAAALARAGCRSFFVATLDEGVRLREALDATGDDAHLQAGIHVLGGLAPGTEDVYAGHRLVPVLNSLGEIGLWHDFVAALGETLGCDIHVDTGMLRLGLPPDETRTLIDDPGRLAGLEIDCVISHLACADELDHPKNAEQLAAFTETRNHLDAGRASFANSSGIFLGDGYHFDLARPGVALYGVGPLPGEPNPMAQVVELYGRIAQVRSVDTPQTVGYGATHRVTGPGRIATVPVGYADGYLRSLSNRATGYIQGIPVPVVGRVSMDLITLDVSEVPEDVAHVGAMIELIGPNLTVDKVAEAAGTIGYEILTSLGARYHRVYVGG